MASIEDLKKEVERLENKLKEESEKTKAVEQQVKSLTDEISALKTKLVSDSFEDFQVKEDEKSHEVKNVRIESQDSSGTLITQTSAPVKVLKIAKSGYLRKKGATRQKWIKRWFTLDSEKKQLEYFEKKDDVTARGIIPLTSATIFTHVEKKGKAKPLYFNIRVLNRDFLLKTDSQEDKDSWVKIIKENIVKGDLPDEAKKMIKPGIIGVTVDSETKKNQ